MRVRCARMSSDVLDVVEDGVLCLNHAAYAYGKDTSFPPYKLPCSE